MSDQVVLDLCAGTCSWSNPWLERGFSVIAFDIVRHRLVPEAVDLRVEDVRYVDARDFRGKVCAVFASPPCDAYARFAMPWTRARNSPPPDLSIWHACERIALEAQAPLVLENVRSAQRWHGQATWHYGPFYIWTRDLPALMPIFQPRFFRKKESYGSKERDRRAMIPEALANHFAEVLSL